MTRILFVISNSNIGGAETLLARVVENLDRTKFEPHVIVTDAIGPLHGRYRAASKYNYIHAVPDKPGAIVSYANAHADIVHVFNHLAMWKFASSIKAPVVASLFMDLTHGSGFADHWRPVAQAALPRLAAVITDYQRNTEVLPGALVIPNGVDTEAFRPLDKVPNSVIWVGRLAESKGIDQILPIAADLKKHHITICAPEVNGALGRALVDYPVPNITIKVGLSDAELRAELGRSELFLSASRSEGMPVSLLEAMSSGCVPVVPAVGAMGQVVSNETNGYVYEAGASPLVVAATIRHADTARSAAARQTIVQDYSLAGMVSKYQAIYDQILDGKKDVT